MAGDGRVRFCSECARNVYNLSGMSRREAEALVRNTEGRLCVAFYRRADGTILSADCPVGLGGLKKRLVAVGAFGVALLLAFLGGVIALVSASGGRDEGAPRGAQPWRNFLNVFDLAPAPPPNCVGKLAPPAAGPVPAPAPGPGGGG
jgi:hypothetical protein